MKLAYDFNLEDWSSFQRFHYSTSPSCRRMRNMGRILLPVAVLLLITSQFLRRRFDPVYFGIFATFSIVWFILYPRWFDAKIIRRSTQFLKEGNTDSMFGRREIELLPDRVHIISPSGRGYVSRLCNHENCRNAERTTALRFFYSGSDFTAAQVIRRGLSAGCSFCSRALCR
jgi:hypothetical protein